MKVLKLIRNTLLIAGIGLTFALWSGCGGVDEAMMEQLENMRDEVSALQSEADSLKEERANLERDLADRNAKLEQCERDKQAAQANLQKLPK